MTVLVVTGTGTEIGKTVTTAAVAAAALAAGRSVAVLKPAQTGVGPGERGDADEVTRLVGGGVTAVELARYPEPLAPATAALRAGLPGAPARGGRRCGEAGDGPRPRPGRGRGRAAGAVRRGRGTLADAARQLRAPVLVVAAAGLGTLNSTALTTEALRARDLTPLGVVIGSWPEHPDLAARCNLADFPEVSGTKLLGAIPEGAGTHPGFRASAPSWLAPELDGTWDAAAFAASAG